MDAPARTTSDIDLSKEIFPHFPPGWRSPSGLTEGFLLAAALEIQARRRIDRLDPWGRHVFPALDMRFRHDGLGSLVAAGPHHPDELRSIMTPDPALNARYHSAFLDTGHFIGRLVLLDLVWRFVDFVYDSETKLGLADGSPSGHQGAIMRLTGTMLGRFGTALFEEIFRSRWFGHHKDPRPLTEAEHTFLRGEPLRAGAGILTPDGKLYVESIWFTAFRLVEQLTPGYFITRYAEKLDTVEYIMMKRAADEAKGYNVAGPYLWTGWPDEADDFAPPSLVGTQNLLFSEFTDEAGFNHKVHWAIEGTHPYTGAYFIESCCTCGKLEEFSGQPGVVRAQIYATRHRETGSYEEPHYACTKEPQYLLFSVGP